MGQVVKALWCAWVVSVLSAGSAWAEQAPEAAPRMALGLIVKLKEAKPPSVVRLKAAAVPSDGMSRQRARMADAARRRRVSFLVQRPTAFAANVIHSGQIMPWAEANAQAERLRLDPDVEWVVVNEILTKQAYVSSPSSLPTTPSQSWLGSVTTTGLPGLANIEPAWAKLTDGRSLNPVVVAVLDTGIRPHPSLQGRYLAGYDFVYRTLMSNDGDGVDPDPTDPGDGITASDLQNHPEVFTTAAGCENKVTASSWHGLEVAGTLGGIINDQAGMLAPLRGATGSEVILPVRVAGKCGAEVSSIIEGMLWSANVPYQGGPASTVNPHPTARVVSLSFGGDGNCSLAAPTSDPGWIYAQTVATLKTQGVLVVASAGNGDGSTGEAVPTSPANCSSVLAVTALNARGYKAGYANLIASGIAVAGGDVNTHVDPHQLIDDGVVVPSYDGTSAYGARAMAGTSFATPQAAGVAAMMLAVNPQLTVDELIQGIKASSRAHVTSANVTGVPASSLPLGNCSAGNRSQCYCTTSTCGSGILDAAAAIDWAAGHAGSFNGPGAYTSPSTYFVPAREAAARPSGGGGGGALDWPELLGLLSLTALASFGLRRPAQSRQAAKPLP